jgi:hypothetical protein
MKTKSSIIAATVAAALASIASAQITPDPTGVNLFSNASAYNATSYNNTLGSGLPTGLGLYFNSNATAPSAQVSSWAAVTSYGILGLDWSAQGGSVKTIFLGESAGEKNDFGYIVNGSNTAVAANYNPLLTDADAPFNIQSGQETFVSYTPGSSLDFWLNNPGTFAGYGSQFLGGTYFSFLFSGAGSAFAGGDPYTHVKYKWVTVSTEYHNGSAWVIGDVETLVIAFEDLRGPAPLPGQAVPIDTAIGDADYTDFIVAFQFLPNQAVPEPSTYGLMGAAGLLGLVGYRRFKASKAKKA